MPLEIIEVHFNCAGSQKLLGPNRCSRCGAMRFQFSDLIGGHLSWHRGSERLYCDVRISYYFVAGAALWTDFRASTVNLDLWTLAGFPEVRGNVDIYIIYNIYILI